MCLNWTHGGGLVCKLRPLARSCCLEGLWRTLAVVYIQIFPWHHHNRPYHCERTASRLICEVKHGRARSVLGWGTTWEARVTIVFFLFLFFSFCCRAQVARAESAVAWSWPWHPRQQRTLRLARASAAAAHLLLNVLLFAVAHYRCLLYYYLHLVLPCM